MTVAETTRRQTYNGSGSTGPFTFNFRVLDSSHISVVKTDADGVDTTLTTPADYSITLVALGQSGGSITLGVALAVDEVLTIRGDTPISQGIGFSNQGAFLPEIHEQALDKLTIVAQEVKEATDENITAITTAADNIDAIIAAPAAATSAATSAAQALATTGLSYIYDSTTTASDPGAGKLRFNNAALASATAMYISETTANALAVAALIQLWDDSTNTIKGLLRLFKQSDPTIWAAFNVTGTITDGGAWDTVTLAYVAGSGTLTTLDAVSLVFSRAGDKGATGTISDGDKGDITVSGSGTTFTIDDSAVTLAKLADTAKRSWHCTFIETPSNGDYTLADSMPFAGKVHNVRTICSAGSCTVTSKINTTALGGTANSASTTAQNQAHTTSNTIAVGDDLVATISANSGCTNLFIYYELERTS